MEKITFTLKEKQYTVKNEKELAMFFQLLDSDNKTVSAVLHWETIMHLDERLLTLITSYRGLISCMKSMNDKNRFLFLIKIGDILGKIITSSEELARILSEIPEEQDKIKLVKQFRRKGLEGIIHSADDLARILEWIYDEGEITVLEMLDYDFFLSLLTKPDDIYKVLNYCSDATKTFIIERIGLLRLKSLVYSAHDFFILLKWFSYPLAQSFLQLFSRSEILERMKDDHIFHSGLRSLSPEKEKMFLYYLWLPPCSTDHQ